MGNKPPKNKSKIVCRACRVFLWEVSQMQEYFQILARHPYFQIERVSGIQRLFFRGMKPKANFYQMGYIYKGLHRHRVIHAPLKDIPNQCINEVTFKSIQLTTSNNPKDLKEPTNIIQRVVPQVSAFGKAIPMLLNSQDKISTKINTKISTKISIIPSPQGCFQLQTEYLINHDFSVRTRCLIEKAKEIRLRTGGEIMKLSSTGRELVVSGNEEFSNIYFM
mmetsp:Transcript_24067/g.33711  ORF Transcript_24067/g.33711 Transcript_24067/m.33711 type:complete len:221 (+) Transcript_24067:671-1333(+)